MLFATKHHLATGAVSYPKRNCVLFANIKGMQVLFPLKM